MVNSLNILIFKWIYLLHNILEIFPLMRACTTNGVVNMVHLFSQSDGCYNAKPTQSVINTDVLPLADIMQFNNSFLLYHLNTFQTQQKESSQGHIFSQSMI